MRKIFFVRHALPEFPDEDKYCIGQTDFPLGDKGKIQCILLKHWTKGLFEGKSVFCSRLTRAKETASYLSPNPRIIDGLEEMYAGLWDGLNFTEIERRWPDILAGRDGEKNIPIPGAEDIKDGLSRFMRAVEKCLESSEGDIVIVAHSTVIQALLAHSASTPLDECRIYKLPYCSVSKVAFDGAFHLEYYGKTQIPKLSQELYTELVGQCGENLLPEILRELACDSLAEEIIKIRTV